MKRCPKCEGIRFTARREVSDIVMVKADEDGKLLIITEGSQLQQRWPTGFACENQSCDYSVHFWLDIPDA